MTDNPFEPAVEPQVTEPTPEPVETPVQVPASEPAPEPVATPTPESAPEVNAAPFAAEEPETETEVVDEENIEKEENQFDDLDEELVDVHDSADTIWLLRRVGMGLLKVVLILGGIGLLAWLIWGDNKNIKSELGRVKEFRIEETVKKPEVVKPKEITPPVKKVVIPEETKSQEEQVETTEITTHGGGLNLASWNYWMETQRLRAQAGTPGDVIRWKREVETLFEISFLQQITGNNSIDRAHKISTLLQRIDYLLQNGDKLQAVLSKEIVDFSTKSNAAQEQSIASEQQFLNAMQESDPTNIGDYLYQKGEAEKDVQKHAVAAEGRRIFSEKIGEYQSILLNVQTAVTVNRDALIQDIQVVNFPADPFGRVIPLEQWTP